MGHPAWTQDGRFATLLGRKAHEDELDARLGEWTQGWEAEALMHALQQAGVPAGVVHTNRPPGRRQWNIPWAHSRGA